MNNKNVGDLMRSMESKYSIKPITTLNTYNSCMNYFISKDVYFGNEQEIINMTERFLVPLDDIKNYGVNND